MHVNCTSLPCVTVKFSTGATNTGLRSSIEWLCPIIKMFNRENFIFAILYKNSTALNTRLNGKNAMNVIELRLKT